jgi:predicted nucleic acid-binding protein
LRGKLAARGRHWDLAAWNYYRCRKKGITLSTLDCLIATVAKEYGVEFWSLGRSFERIAPIIGMERWGKWRMDKRATSIKSYQRARK